MFRHVGTMLVAAHLAVACSKQPKPAPNPTSDGPRTDLWKELLALFEPRARPEAEHERPPRIEIEVDAGTAQGVLAYAFREGRNEGTLLVSEPKAAENQDELSRGEEEAARSAAAPVTVSPRAGIREPSLAGSATTRGTMIEAAPTPPSTSANDVADAGTTQAQAEPGADAEARDAGVSTPLVEGQPDGGATNDREARDREARDREARDREARDREARDREAKEQQQRIAQVRATWEAIADRYGAGPGFTGETAGFSGSTGIGAGPGYTGIGAGTGHTGIGAGPGHTGIGAGPGSTGTGASALPSASASASSAPGQNPSSPPGTLLFWFTPWGPIAVPLATGAPAQ